MKGEAIFTYIGSEDQSYFQDSIHEDGLDKASLPCIYLLELVPGATKNAKFGCGKGKSNVDDIAAFIKDYQTGKVKTQHTLQHLLDRNQKDEL